MTIVINSFLGRTGTESITSTGQYTQDIVHRTTHARWSHKEESNI